MSIIPAVFTWGDQAVDGRSGLGSVGKGALTLSPDKILNGVVGTAHGSDPSAAANSLLDGGVNKVLYPENVDDHRCRFGQSNGGPNRAQIAGDIQRLLDDLGAGGMPSPYSSSAGSALEGAQNASGTLAAYMNSRCPSLLGLKATLTVKDLYLLAQNADGKTPAAVSQAANYMLQNPDVYRQIETHDVAGADGKTNVGNFQWAAQGGLNMAGAPNRTGVYMPSPYSSSAGSALEGAQNASGTLAAYMNSRCPSLLGLKATLTVKDLYLLAQNADGKTPAAVSQAANYMLQNPDVYRQIETHDVAGADGKTNVGNFQWAAQGGLNMAGAPNRTGVYMPSPYSSSAGSALEGAQNASGTLAAYMNSRCPSLLGLKATLTVKDLYLLAQNADGKTPAAVSQAANYMLQNPDVYRQIETHDVAGADGKTNVGNFQWAAQGGLNMAGAPNRTGV
ncbi:hypothetical protein KAF44_24770 (plasmid) [Cupriavidus necator]|nr:hypothetical protein KAF44_24770 [Cupriavidus necator]